MNLSPFQKASQIGPERRPVPTSSRCRPARSCQLDTKRISGLRNLCENYAKSLGLEMREKERRGEREKEGKKERKRERQKETERESEK